MVIDHLLAQLPLDLPRAWLPSPPPTAYLQLLVVLRLGVNAPEQPSGAAGKLAPISFSDPDVTWLNGIFAQAGGSDATKGRKKAKRAARAVVRPPSRFAANRRPCRVLLLTLARVDQISSLRPKLELAAVPDTVAASPPLPENNSPRVSRMTGCAC